MNNFSITWPELVQNVEQTVQQYGPRALFVVLVFVFFFLVAQLFKLYGTRSLDINLYKRPTLEAIKLYNRTRRRILLGRFFWLFFNITAWISALLVAGINPRSVLEGLGFVGVAVAFALSDLIQQYIGGFMILTQEHFNIGEQVTVGDVHGVIKAIESRYTIIRDFTEQDVSVPNTDMLKRAVRVSRVEGLHRDVVRVRIALDSDVAQAIRIGEQAVAGTSGVDGAVAPRGYLRYFGDSLQLAFYYTGPAARREQFIVRSAVLINLKSAFDKAKITISYPSGYQFQETEED